MFEFFRKSKTTEIKLRIVRSHMKSVQWSGFMTQYIRSREYCTNRDNANAPPFIPFRSSYMHSLSYRLPF